MTWTRKNHQPNIQSMKTTHHNDNRELSANNETEATALQTNNESRPVDKHTAAHYIFLDCIDLDKKARSAWRKGVASYALALSLKLGEYLVYRKEDLTTKQQVVELLLNGAKTWQRASESGSWPVDTQTIAESLLPPSQAKKLTCNYKALALQARALEQAANYIAQQFIYYTR